MVSAVASSCVRFTSTTAEDSHESAVAMLHRTLKWLMTRTNLGIPRHEVPQMKNHFDQTWPAAGSAKYSIADTVLSVAIRLLQ